MARNLAGGGTRGSVKRASGPSSIMRPGNKAEPSTSEITHISGQNAISVGDGCCVRVGAVTHFICKSRGCHIFSCNKNNKRESDGHRGQQDIPLNLGMGKGANEGHFFRAALDK